MPMREDVRDHESSEYDARNSVGRHEGQVHPSQVIRLDDAVLIDQHATEHGNTQPIPDTKMAQ